MNIQGVGILDTKKCSVCDRELPARREYFYELNRRGKKGFRSKCRECLGYKFLPIEREGYQHCKKCGTEHPLTEEFFSKSGTTFTGFLRSCRECQREKSREWKTDNPERVKEYDKRRWDENTESEKARNKKYYYDNQVKCQTRSVTWSKNNPDKVKAKIARNPEKYRLMWIAYRSKKKKLTTTLTREDWEESQEYFNHQCCYCGKELKSFTKEHVIPVSRGGPLVRTNIVPSCKSCNSSKINSDMEVWYRKQPFFSAKRLAKIYKWIGMNPKTKTQQLSMF